MNVLRKPITISLSPNSTKSDCWLALKYLKRPWKWGSWKEGPEVKELEAQFRAYFSQKIAISFVSGRESLYAILKALNLEEGSEIILQAFTCLVVPNSIIWAGLKPVYVDVDETINLDPSDLEKKITAKTKAVIVQHTFGEPAELDKILEICKKHNLILIEDCAHALGSKYKNKLVGTYGDVAFFSFGRDKIISSVHGGMVVTNNSEIGERLKEIQKQCPFPNWLEIFGNLKHPLAFGVILPTYFWFGLGKVLLIFLQKIKAITLVITAPERKSEKPKSFCRRLPTAQADIALNQFSKLEEFNKHRKELAEFYSKELSGSKIKLPVTRPESDSVFLRYTIQVDNPDKLRREAKKHFILLGDWYNKVVAPAYTDLEKVQYKPGSCPQAETLVKRVVNLPTGPRVSLEDAGRVVEVVNKF